jgi:glycosyltransferase involved in cell wall biosynthesis
VMTPEPLVSVVIPAYNANRFIERTLRSALRQTYSNLEVIIIDDGSTDNTRSLAEAVVAGDERVRIIGVRNGGVAKARNIGIDESSGAFIAFLDADDLWHPTTLELQVSSLLGRSGKDAGAAYAFSRVIDVNDRAIQTANALACSGYVLARLMYAKFIGNGSSMLVRREVAIAVGGFESAWAARGIGGCEDLDFELKIAAKYPLAAIPRFLVGYRIYPGNMSSDKTRMARALVATVEHHVRVNPDLPAWAASKARSSTSEYALSLLLRDRRWMMACAEFARLARFDPGRAFDVAATVVARRLRRLRAAHEVPTSIDLPIFSALDPSSQEGPASSVSRRDVREMEELGKLDGALAGRREGAISCTASFA